MNIKTLMFIVIKFFVIFCSIFQLGFLNIYAQHRQVTGKSHCPDFHHESMCCSAENTKAHHTWETCYLLEFVVRHPTRMGELLHAPGWVAIHLHWDPIFLLQVGPAETLCLKLNKPRGEREAGVGPGLAYPTTQPISSHLTVLPPSAPCTYN